MLEARPLGVGLAVNSGRLGLNCLLFVLCFAAAGSAPTVAGGPFEPPPLSNVQGEVVNFETPLIKPLIVTADGAKAWVVATVADALLVYDAEAKVHVKTVPLAVVHNGRTPG